MKCPICLLALTAEPRDHPNRDAKIFECPRCGTYSLDALADPLLARLRSDQPNQLGLLSHLVRRMQRDDQSPFLDIGLIELLLAENQMPSPSDQADNLILWLGNHLDTPGPLVSLNTEEHRAVSGALNDDNFYWLLRYLVNSPWIEGKLGLGNALGTLSFEGWTRFQELKRGRRGGETAFMAMPFDDDALDRVFEECFKPAVGEAGFELLRLDDRPSAGLIDSRLRVEIRRARFLVADLTEGNHGAYWEAGFAEGLGKPVIYTCEHGYFRDRGTHFDTSHHHTVTWLLEALEDAAERLTATVRATLPEEAAFPS